MQDFNLFSPEVVFAFMLTIFAGLSTGIGSALAFFSKKTNEAFLSAALGFSAGVMIYVSFVEIFAKANESLSSALGESQGYLITTISFFAGIALIGLIDKFVPSYENPHEIRDTSDMKKSLNDEGNNKELLRMGMFSALAIAIHNFPEGLATFVGALQDPSIGISIGVAIAIHNIPEGIAVSVPFYYATGSNKNDFWLSLISGFAEPIGALLGFTILLPFFNDLTFGILFAMVAGIMVYISLDELLPTAEKYAKHHIAIWGLISGMAIMAISLVMFA
jgi:ZIP family zinc transporter